MPARYAVYYAPSAGDALHQAVTPLLGRDALGGLNVPQATPPGVDPVFWKAVTRVPAHYGLHATLKAPFELRHSGMESQLLRSTGEVASRFLPFAIPSLSLAYLGKEEKGFYADELSGEGPFLRIINKQYSSKLNRITLVLAEEVDESKFSKQVWGWIKSIL